MENELSIPPPPAYQQSGKACIQPYYIPSFAPPEYAPPQQPSNPELKEAKPAIGQRIYRFYMPLQNKQLGLRRRYYSLAFCSIVVSLAILVAVGIAYKGASEDRSQCYW